MQAAGDSGLSLAAFAEAPRHKLQPLKEPPCVLTFAGTLHYSPSVQQSLDTACAFDPQLTQARTNFQHTVGKPKRCIHVNIGQAKDYTPEQLQALNINTTELPETTLIATLEGERELKGLLPTLRRWLTGFSTPTHVNELLMMSDGNTGLSQFIKATNKELKSRTFWSTFSPKTSQASAVVPMQPNLRVSHNTTSPTNQQAGFSVSA